MARLGTIKFPAFPDFRADPAPDFKALSAEQDREMEKLQAKSDSLAPGEIVGALVRWPRADGYAYYVVTKEKPLTLAHVPYLDAYQVEGALIRGLNRADILAMLEGARDLARLFGPTKASRPHP